MGKLTTDQSREESFERPRKGQPRLARNGGPVLVVDSDRDAARSLAESLELHGLSVFVARDVKHAMSILEFRAFTALIVGVDPALEELLDLVSCSCCLCPRTDVVAIGSNIAQAEERALLNRGVRLVLPEPVDVAKLLGAISRKSVRSSFTGTVEDADILDYLQFLILAGKKTILEITSRLGTKARIFLCDGRAVHAECGVLEGVQALYRCLCFMEGTFAHKPWEEPERTTITIPSELLLMEAARKRDDAWCDTQ